MDICNISRMKKVVDNRVAFDLKDYQKEVIAKVKDTISDFISDVEISATRDAPRFLSIDKAFTNGGLTAEVGVMGGQVVSTGQSSASNIAAYWEFGTGLSAAEITAGYPQWVKDKAMEYYVSGQGTLIGQPYLFNNFLNYLTGFKKDISRTLDENRKK